jgi:hypothetical protein
MTDVIHFHTLPAMLVALDPDQPVRVALISSEQTAYQGMTSQIQIGVHARQLRQIVGVPVILAYYGWQITTSVLNAPDGGELAKRENAWRKADAVAAALRSSIAGAGFIVAGGVLDLPAGISPVRGQPLEVATTNG